MATEIFDRVTQYGSGYAGLPAEKLSQAYANEFIAAVIEWPISMVTTKLGEKFVEFVIGLSMSGTGFLLADRMGLSNRTKMDLHELAAHFLNRAADPDPRETIQIQEDLIDTVNAFRNEGLSVADKAKQMIARNRNELEADLEAIANNNKRLKDMGLPVPDFMTKAGTIIPIPPNGETMSTGDQPVEGELDSSLDKLSAIQKASTEAKYLSEEEDITIRGGF